jgi:hypothetical protein
MEKFRRKMRRTRSARINGRQGRYRGRVIQKRGKRISC